MTQFYTRAPNSPSTGSPAYAQTVLNFYFQNFLSGMVEIDTPEDQFVFLLSEGGMVGAYRFEGGCYASFPADQLSSFWTSGDAYIRSSNLPREAVRAAKQGLEWFPPLNSWDQPTSEIPAFLDSFRKEMFDGLIHFQWERSEGFLAMRGGQVVLMDTICSSLSEVSVSEANFPRLLAEKSSVCRVSCYAARPGTSAADQQMLRLALTGWSDHILQRYLQLVGRNLINALAQELNGFMRAKPLHIQLSGESLHDSHIFVTTEHCVQAYQLLMRAMAAHMGKVIGIGLTRSVLFDSYQKLSPGDQSVLSQHALLPAFIPHS
jgi:hypothetical protein